LQHGEGGWGQYIAWGGHGNHSNSIILNDAILPLRCEFFLVQAVVRTPPETGISSQGPVDRQQANSLKWYPRLREDDGFSSWSTS
jgi:hypothetical protein